MLSIHLKFGSSSLKGLGGVRSVTEIFINKKCGQTDGQILNHLLVYRFSIAFQHQLFFTISFGTAIFDKINMLKSMFTLYFYYFNYKINASPPFKVLENRL